MWMAILAQVLAWAVKLLLDKVVGPWILEGQSLVKAAPKAERGPLAVEWKEAVEHGKKTKDWEPLKRFNERERRRHNGKRD